MSLINEVLRKLDEDHRPHERGPRPSLLQSAGRRGEPHHWLAAGAALGGLVVLAGLGGWFLWVPSGADEGAAPEDRAVASRPATGSEATPPEPAGDPATSEPEGPDSAPDAGSAPAAGPEPGQEAASVPKQATAQGPRGGRTEPATASSDGTSAPDPESPAEPSPAADSSPEEEAAATAEVEEKAPARPALKQAPEIPVKIPVGPSREQASGARPDGSGASGDGSGGERPAARPDRSDARASDRAGGQVQVSVPKAWQDREQAQRLAREGFAALRAGRHGHAAERLAAAYRLAPDRADVANNLGLAQWRAGQRRAAVSTLIGGVRDHPGDSRLARNLGHLLGQVKGENLRENGLRALAGALRQQQRVALYARVGTLLREWGRGQEAVSIYRRGLARKGGHWRLLMGLGESLEAQDQPGEALEVYRKALDRLPERRDGVAQRLTARVEALERSLN